MTPFVITLNLLRSGPKKRTELEAALGGRSQLYRVINQLLERRDIKRIRHGVYALPNHPTLPKK